MVRDHSVLMKTRKKNPSRKQLSLNVFELQGPCSEADCVLGLFEKTVSLGIRGLACLKQKHKLNYHYVSEATCIDFINLNRE